MQPQAAGEYQKLLTDVIKKQVVILGRDITLAKVRSVPGLSVLDDGTVLEITGNPAQITQKLIDAFMELSELIVKKTMEPLLTLVQVSQETLQSSSENAELPQQEQTAAPQALQSTQEAAVPQPKEEQPTPSTQEPAPIQPQIAEDSTTPASTDTTSQTPQQPAVTVTEPVQTPPVETPQLEIAPEISQSLTPEPIQPENPTPPQPIETSPTAEIKPEETPATTPEQQNVAETNQPATPSADPVSIIPPAITPLSLDPTPLSTDTTTNGSNQHPISLNIETPPATSPTEPVSTQPETPLAATPLTQPLNASIPTQDTPNPIIPSPLSDANNQQPTVTPPSISSSSKNPVIPVVNET